jgi:plasmid stabilization system protein ParE
VSRPIVLTPQAQQDFRRIGRTSLKSFGPNQLRRHLRRLEAAFVDLASERRLGLSRSRP